MMFDVIRLSKQCRSGYINTVRCLPAKSCACLACLAYHNEHTRMLEKKLTRFGQEPLFNGMKRKYVKGKLAAAAIISLEQEKASAWYSEKHPKIRPTISPA